MRTWLFLAHFFWDPNPEVFRIPIIDRPVVWYGILFTFGFVLGYGILYLLFYRFFSKYPHLIDSDIDPVLLYKLDKFKSAKAQRILQGLTAKKLNIPGLTSHFNQYIDKAKSLDGKWELRESLVQTFSPHLRSLKKKTLFLCDKLTVYVVIATIIGARLFHVFFYEKPSFYLSNPLKILYVWEGGLASHGAAIGIVLAIILFSYRYRSFRPKLDWLRVLDYVSLPALVAAFFIRLGNFTNQEILGTKTALPWAVIFGHPVDGGLPVARHPVSLYEALYYLLLFIILFPLAWKTSLLEKKGKLIGLFLIVVFTFRFFIEFLKEEQSELLNTVSTLTMGQYLSIPLVILGGYLLLRKNKV